MESIQSILHNCNFSQPFIHIIIQTISYLTTLPAITTQGPLTVMFPITRAAWKIKGMIIEKAIREGIDPDKALPMIEKLFQTIPTIEL